MAVAISGVGFWALGWVVLLVAGMLWWMQGAVDLLQDIILQASYAAAGT
jgi:hypothetical protein